MFHGRRLLSPALAPANLQRLGKERTGKPGTPKGTGFFIFEVKMDSQPDATPDAPDAPVEQPTRRRGRPPGKREKRDPDVLPGLAQKLVDKGRALQDYRHPDPDSIVSRQLAMLDIAQKALQLELRAGLQCNGDRILLEDIQKLEKLSNTVVRAIEALRRSSDLASELASRLTPEQLLEAALQKVEGQDIPTLRYAIKRLRAHLERLAPTAPVAAKTALEAVTNLED